MGEKGSGSSAIVQKLEGVICRCSAELLEMKNQRSLGRGVFSGLYACHSFLSRTSFGSACNVMAVHEKNLKIPVVPPKFL